MTHEIATYDRSHQARAHAALATLGTSNGTKYTVEFVNNSINGWSFCCYQKLPEQPKDLLSLAWFAKQVFPGTVARFTWSVDYNLLWAETGVLTPGVVFSATETIAADPVSANHTGLTRDGGGGFHFDPSNPLPPDAQYPKGTLGISCDGTVPNNKVSVGLGMSGFGTYAYQGGPNVKTAFDPTPFYYVGFAKQVQEGLALTTTQFLATAQVRFPTATFVAKCVLGEDNLWTVTYS